MKNLLRRGLGPLTLALMSLTGLSSNSTRATGPAPATSQCIATAATAPREFPDPVHLANGCYVSSIAFVAKFTAAFPAERAMAVTINPRNFDTPHTIALLTWRGSWWGRDALAGVFPLNQRVDSKINLPRLQHAATLVFEQQSTHAARRRHYDPAKTHPKPITAAERAHAIAVAAHLVPFPSERFYLRTGDTEVALLFFLPGPETIAVYDPVSGTALAKTTARDSLAIVRAVVRQLGYNVDSLRREPKGPGPALFATVP